MRGHVVDHVVTPNPLGWFDVTSARSGNVYRVLADGSCSCDGWRYWRRCSHAVAVFAFAATVTRSTARVLENAR